MRIWIDTYSVESVYDTLTVIDKDGTTLGHFDKWGGDWTVMEWQKEMISKTDTVEVRFHSDGSGEGYYGWRLFWRKLKVLRTWYAWTFYNQTILAEFFGTFVDLSRSYILVNFSLIVFYRNDRR